MSVISSIKEWVASCPSITALTDDVNIDILGPNSMSFSIEKVACNPNYSQYIDGTVIKQYQFQLVSKFMWSDETDMNKANLEFFEEFESWVKTMNDNDSLPVIENCESLEVEIMSNGVLGGVTADMKYGRYQITCRLIYKEA